MSAAPTVLDLDAGERAMYVLPFPTKATQAVLQAIIGRNAATLFGVCPFCGAGSEFMGVDHREVRHGVMEHTTDCPASDDALSEQEMKFIHLALIVEVASLPSGV